jgi:DHA2 family multidrug resistance protein-like MFS transporter
VIGGGLGLSAVGLAVLTQVGAGGGLPALVVGSVVISLGLAPVFALTTELIVGSAPPERAGAASGISETGAELGGALGLAIMGSVGVAIYRSELTDHLPAGVPAGAATVARDTLGSAVAVAERLPDQLGAPLLAAAREAFVQGMRFSSATAAVVAVGLTVLALVMLRDRPAATAAADDADNVEELEAAEPVGGARAAAR